MNAVAHPVPCRAPTFADLRATYEAALAAERAHDQICWPAESHGLPSSDMEAENDRLTDERYRVEDRLMAMPSPDPAAFAFKYLVAHGGGRETDCWDGMLEEEARRLSTLPLHISQAWRDALTDYEAKKAYWDRCDASRSPNCDKAGEIALSAQDHLVENVRAPNVEAAIFKMELAKERWEGFSIPDEWLDVFAADLRHLVPTTVEPRSVWWSGRHD